MSVSSSVEQSAFEVVRQVLGVSVEEYDIGPRQRAVDALLHYPHGGTAALEVSSIGPADEARITNVLDGGTRRAVDGLSSDFFVLLEQLQSSLPASAKIRS